MIPLVLTVDDDKVTQMLNQMIFTRCGFSKTSVTCMNGKEALQFFEKKLAEGNLAYDLPAIIFLDLNMPVMDGWDFLMEMEKLDVSIKENTIIYILSSSIDDKDIARAHAISLVKDYVIKPVDEEKLNKIFNC